MLFQTANFFVFFAAFLLAYWLLRHRLRFQNLLILAGSYFFYGAWDERFLSLIIISTATDYLTGIGASEERVKPREIGLSIGFLLVGASIALVPTLPQSGSYLVAVGGFGALLALVTVLGNRLQLAARKRLFLWTSIIVNLGVLGVFKYFDFFGESLSSLAAAAGINLGYSTLNIVLPVGISFYTFQTMSYTLDIYRGRIKPTRQLLEFAAFVSFFPQLVAGPIERAANLLPQFFKHRHLSWQTAQTGATLFVWGMFKKVFIADNLAPIADAAFTDPVNATSGQLLVGLVAFTFQIYCDFSGYSDMARGLARILGFNLMLNFNLPYFARTPSEFWQRWHISLSSWLRDYLYFSLGGNRNGNLRTYRNLALTMLLGGLWHGASWTFVIWGAFHGGILILYRAFSVDRWIRLGSTVVAGFNLARARDACLIAVMFGLTMIGWLLFRARTLDVLSTYWTGLTNGQDWSDGDWQQIFLYTLPLLIVQAAQIYKKELELFWHMPFFVRLNFALFAGYSLLFLTTMKSQAFIYFDF